MSQALFGYILIAILFTTAFAAILWMARFKDPDELWIGHIQRVSIVILLAAVTTTAFGLFYDRAEEIGPGALLLLQVAKDATGLLLIAASVEHYRSSSVSASTGTGILDYILWHCPKILIVGLLLAIVAGALGGQQAQLDDGAAAWATLYRSFIYAPTAFYSAMLTYVLIIEAKILGRVDWHLKLRYYMFSVGATTWSLLALDHLVKPSVLNIVYRGPESLIATSADIVVVGLWIIMAFCWVCGFAAKPKLRTRADNAVAATNRYRASSTSLVARLDEPAAIWRKRIIHWQRVLAELAETIRELCTTHDKSKDEADRQIRIAKTALNILAMLRYESYESCEGSPHTKKELEHHCSAYEANVSGIPEESPGKQVLIEDRVALAARESLLLVEEDEVHCLQNELEWVQAVALISAELSLLPAQNNDELLDPYSGVLDPNVHQALKDVRFLFRDRPFDL